jgi:hypothetical protein
MTIYTFGCSWTYGVKGNYHTTENDTISWPEELAEQFPDIVVEDYSYPGTCIEYSLFLFNHILKKKTPDDKVVFQFTMPYRYTTWTDSNKLLGNDYRYNKLSNYSKFEKSLYSHIERYVGNNVFHQNQGKLDKVFHNKYYIKLNERKELASYYAITEYVKQHADFAFFHKDYNKYVSAIGKTLTLNDYKFYPSVENMLGDKLFQSYSWDISKHFNQEGCKHVADIVATKIGLKNEN